MQIWRGRAKHEDATNKPSSKEIVKHLVEEVMMPDGGRKNKDKEDLRQKKGVNEGVLRVWSQAGGDFRWRLVSGRTQPTPWSLDLLCTITLASALIGFVTPNLPAQLNCNVQTLLHCMCLRFFCVLVVNGGVGFGCSPLWLWWLCSGFLAEVRSHCQSPSFLHKCILWTYGNIHWLRHGPKSVDDWLYKYSRVVSWSSCSSNAKKKSHCTNIFTFRFSVFCEVYCSINTIALGGNTLDFLPCISQGCDLSSLFSLGWLFPTNNH